MVTFLYVLQQTSAADSTKGLDRCSPRGFETAGGRGNALFLSQAIRCSPLTSQKGKIPGGPDDTWVPGRLYGRVR